MVNLLGIKFAPWNIPLERRLQTLAAGTWFITLAFGGIFGMIASIYFLFYTKYWWIMSIYLFWCLVDRTACERGSRPSEWVKNWLWWKYLCDYFSFRLHRVPWAELDPKRNYLFCCFPHGMLPAGSFMAFSTNYGGFKGFFPHHQSHLITLEQHYHMPFLRELGLCLGGISSSAKSISYVLNRPGGGRVCALEVGGAEESYYCRPGDYKLVLKKRKGFVKLALRTGAPLVPVFSFGETDLFTQFENSEGSRYRRFQETLRKYIGLAPIIPLGRGFFQYSFGLVPQRRRITTLVGKPIDVEKVEDPTQEQIDALHKEFIEKLQELFEEQKHNYLENAAEKKLIIY